jgi:hypothetical protein
MKRYLDTDDILLIVYLALCTLLIFLPCIVLCVAALCCATSVFEVCFLVFIIIGLAAIDGGLWWLIFI